MAALVVAGSTLVLPTTSASPPAAATGPDEFDLVGGCYLLTATGDDATSAGPFRFQATDLARYLLHAGSGGVVTAPPAIGDLPLGGGVTFGPAEPAAEWAVETHADGFAFTQADGRGLVVTGGALAVDRPVAPLRVTPAEGCVELPDAQIGVAGPVATGTWPTAEVRGFLDDHLHITAFEFLGGRVHCGRPWHPYGVTYALRDCPDHEVADGSVAVLENLLADGDPVGTHDPQGWPSFTDWPAPRSLTHEQTYHRWMERAWRGGLRLVVNLITDNRVLCELYPLKQNSCDEMDSVRLQTARLQQLERYIDAQAGGPGEGWFRIVDDPFDAREVINAGKVAVVQGIELSEPFGCRILLGQPLCTPAAIDAQLDELHDAGIRQAVVIHKFDNALGGVTGDGGTVGTITNTGNLLSTGRFLDMGACEGTPPGVNDNAQGLPGIDHHETELFTALLEAFGPPGLAPLYEPGPQCNNAGLTDLGRHTVDGMMARGIVVDIDHMSVRARDEALDRIEAAGYAGVMSSHSWATDDAYPRVVAAGGMVSPYAGSSTGFAATWAQRRLQADPRYYWGIGYGADANGLGHQGNPRGPDAPNPVTYPFAGFGGTTIDRQVTGDRTFDINTDGVAHYGLYPDWIEDLRMLAGDQIVRDLERGPEAYLQMWERASGVPTIACGATRGEISVGMTVREVLTVAGQPEARQGDSFSYCDQSVRFDRSGRVVAAGTDAVPAELPATGRSHALTLGLAVLAVALVTVRPLRAGER